MSARSFSSPRAILVRIRSSEDGRKTVILRSSTGTWSRLLNQSALLLQAQANFRAAEPHFHHALVLTEKAHGKNHPDVSTYLANLAQLLQDTNRTAEAEPLMRRALAMDEAAFGKDHPNAAIRLNNLAQLLKATNRMAEAEPLMRRVLDIY